MSKHTEHIAFFIRQKLQLPALYVRAAALLLLALLLLRHRTRCRRRRCQRHPHMPRHADSLAVPVYFTRVPMHEQPRGAGAVSPAFPRNASCVPPTRLRRSRRFVGTHRRLPYRREDHRKLYAAGRSQMGTGGAAVMLLYRAGLAFAAPLYGQFIIKKRPHRAEFIFCLRTCAVTSGTHPVALCRKTRKKPKNRRKLLPAASSPLCRTALRPPFPFAGSSLCFPCFWPFCTMPAFFSFYAGFSPALGSPCRFPAHC